jgi:hypothetical protein
MSDQVDIVDRLDHLRLLDHQLPLRLREAAEFLRLLGRSDTRILHSCNTFAACCLDAVDIIESTDEACFYARETIEKLRVEVNLLQGKRDSK